LYNYKMGLQREGHDLATLVKLKSEDNNLLKDYIIELTSNNSISPRLRGFICANDYIGIDCSYLR
jgi:hypothetical protein